MSSDENESILAPLASATYPEPSETSFTTWLSRLPALNTRTKFPSLIQMMIPPDNSSFTSLPSQSHI